MLQLIPTHPEASGLADRCRQEIKAKQEREAKRLQEVQALKEKVSPLFTEASVLYSTKDYAGARSVLKQALEISPMTRICRNCR